MVSPDDFRRLSRRLEEYHALFYTMWQMGRPVMNESIDTACVSFNKSGDLLEFAFNPDFWNSCNDEDRIFTIAHECLHVMLRHGVRTKDATDLARCNVALDLVVNHSLIDTFGFDRETLTHGKGFCWVDTVFPDRNDIADNLAFEEYFNLLSSTNAEAFSMVDDHSSWSGDSEETVKTVADRLSESERESLKETVESHSAGINTGSIWVFVSAQAKRKRKWETVIQKWAKKYDRSDFQDVEQWARLNRRYTFLNGGLILPSDMEVEDDTEGKIEVWFFQDTSGSCSGYHQRFFTAAKSLPPDRFDVKMHCFDTRVFETTLESGKLFGFGGTAFQPIESYIQSYMKKNKTKYPQAVFVITDGYGSHVDPQIPERWYWFLTSACTYYVPPESLRYQLKDFE